MDEKKQKEIKRITDNITTLEYIKLIREQVQQEEYGNILKWKLQSILSILEVQEKRIQGNMEAIENIYARLKKAGSILSIDK